VKQFQNYLVMLLILAVVGCSSSEDPITEADFFPLQKGQYQIYDVEAIVYELGEPDTAHYELMTEVVDSFQSDNVYRYIIHRSKRDDSENDWTYLDTWSAEKTSESLIIWEENIPFVNLKFPAQEGMRWNGNAYNNIVNPSTGQRDDEYVITETGAGHEGLEGRFVTVLQEDNQEFIVYYDRRQDTFVDRIGLAYREITQLEYCTESGCLGEQVVNSGRIIKQRITSYGRH
jgi:hypothetical protein